MKTIQLWSVRPDGDGSPRATCIESVKNTETEQKLEDLLIASPGLLEVGLAVIGRQVSTEGGPLDLVGIDEDGRVVVFELKRGTLTREAVAQILDYASDLATMDGDRFARIIEEHSGRGGIIRIEDFDDWYSREYPDATAPLADVPRMVLVGLGADDRARRIVNFLADSGIDIQLLTFHAFSVEDQLLLARQVESVEPAGDRSGSQTKEANRKVLLENAESLGVRRLLDTSAAYIEARMPGYLWPGKTAYTYSLQEKTSEGRPSLRAYVTLYLNFKSPGSLLLTLTPRAIKAAGQAVNRFCAHMPAAHVADSGDRALELAFTDDDWPNLSVQLDQLLEAIVTGWKSETSEREQRATESAGFED